MGKFLGLVVIIALIVIGFNFGSSMFDRAAGPSRKSQGKENAQGSLVPIRPFFETACKAHGCTIVQYSEPEKYFVEITVSGRDRNSVTQFLDDLTPPNSDLVKDMDLSKARYWQSLENGSEVFYASYRLRAYK